MHLCTISVDRYLSLRFPLKFGRNKTRRRVVLKILFVWLLSIAMSLPLSLMYSKVNLIIKLYVDMKLRPLSFNDVPYKRVRILILPIPSNISARELETCELVSVTS